MRDLARGVRTVLAASWRISPRQLLASAVLLLLSGLSFPLIAVSLGAAVDAAVERRAGPAVIAVTVTAVAAMMALTMEHFAHIFFFELGDRHRQRTEQEIGELAHGTVELAHQERREVADRMELLRQQTAALGASVQTVLTAGVLLLQIAVTGVLLAQVQPWLLLLPLFGLVPVLCGRIAESRLERAELRTAESARLSWHLLDLAVSPAAAKEVRLFGLGDLLRHRHAAERRTVDRDLRRAELAGLLLRGAGQFVFAVGYIGAIVLVVRTAINGQRSVGDIVLTITLAVQTNAQAANAVALAQSLQRSARVVSWLRWLRAEAPAHPAADQPPPEVMRSGIDLTGVSFRYPGTERDVLRDVTVHIPAGSTVAVVGDNGAGKSTLVKLLCQFHQPTGGTITVDGVDLRRLDPLRWRSRITAAFQDYLCIEAPVRQSIGLGDRLRIDTPGAVEAAVHRADAQQVVDRLPQGLDSHLGKAYANGTELSGGQWQRIALSRAMMRERPLLLLLDEPTAALDPMTEHALFERYAASAREMGAGSGAVTVYTSHRLSTVRTADLILVVSDGRIAEAGRHNELVELGGIYAALFDLQAATYR